MVRRVRASPPRTAPRGEGLGNKPGDDISEAHVHKNTLRRVPVKGRVQGYGPVRQELDNSRAKP